jgi:ribonuclease P protein component
VKTWEPLRGYGVMERVYARGRRLDTERIRCIYLLVHTTLPVVQVAFGAPSKVFGAVQRNRLKRLMREAFAREWNTLQQDLAGAGVSASLLFIFKGKKGERGTRFTLQAVHKSIASICTTLRTEL